MMTLMLKIMATNGLWVPCCDTSGHKEKTPLVETLRILSKLVLSGALQRKTGYTL